MPWSGGSHSEVPVGGGEGRRNLAQVRYAASAPGGQRDLQADKRWGWLELRSPPEEFWVGSGVAQPPLGCERAAWEGWFTQPSQAKLHQVCAVP